LRRFVNVAGCGFDAAVAERVNRGYRFLSGTSAYIASVLATLAFYRPSDLTVVVDGAELRGPAMTCAVANGASYGGGMRIAPDARFDDGVFDVCVIGACTRTEFLRSFPLVFRGTHVDHPKVTMIRGRTIEIVSSPPVPVLADGELAGQTPARFAMMPAGVRFVVPLRMSGVAPARGGQPV
jgi:diacylglycerol kinase (ATP)